MSGMGPDDIPLFAMLKSRMGYLSEQQKVIAQNVANGDTPDYQPRDLKAYSFKATLAQQSAGQPYRGGPVAEPTGGVQMIATSAHAHGAVQAGQHLAFAGRSRQRDHPRRQFSDARGPRCSR